MVAMETQGQQDKAPADGGQPRLDCITLADQRICREVYPAPHASRRAFWAMAVIFLLGMAGGTVPSPLYPLYQAEYGFSNATVTVIFALYGAGVLLSLLWVGRASDMVGRRPMLTVSMGLAGLSTIAFLLAQGLALLLVGRFFSGLSIGILTGTATASLAELEPTGNRRFASIVSGIVTPGGLGLGSLFTGFAIEFGPVPFRLIFGIYLGLLTVLTAGIWLLPETVPARDHAGALRLRGVRVPGPMWREFAIASVGVFSTFAMMSLFASLVPSFLAERLDQPSHLVGGGALTLLFGAAALAPPTIGRGSIKLVGMLGLAAEAAGLFLLVIGLGWEILAAVLVGSAVAGFGGGCFFVSTLAVVNREAPPERRGEVVSAYFVAGYVGVTLPPIVLGIGSVKIGTIASVTIMCAIIVGLAAATAAGLAWQRPALPAENHG